MKHIKVHGSYPFSDWESIWTTFLKDIPAAAALVFVADAIAKLRAEIPSYQEEPPEVVGFLLNKTFRIIRAYTDERSLPDTDIHGSDLFLAVYNHDGRFSLIQATAWNYQLVAAKKAHILDEPPIPYMGL